MRGKEFEKEKGKSGEKKQSKKLEAINRDLEGIGDPQRRGLGR